MSEEIYFSGDEILVIDEHGITPYKILRVVKREFKLLTKYYYELQSSNQEIKWISSLDLKNKTVVRISPENTCGGRNPPKENLPKKKVINIGDLDLNKLGSDIKNALVEKDLAKVTTIEPKSESLTADTVCNEAWHYDEYHLWFIKTEVGNFIRVIINNKVFLIKTNATLNDLDAIFNSRVNHSSAYSKVKDVFGTYFTVIG